MMQSYYNLSKSFLKFTRNKSEIRINQGLIYQLEVGAFSDPIIIDTIEICKQRLVLIPLFYDLNIIFDRT